MAGASGHDFSNVLRQLKLRQTQGGIHGVKKDDSKYKINQHDKSEAETFHAIQTSPITDNGENNRLENPNKTSRLHVLGRGGVQL